MSRLGNSRKSQAPWARDHFWRCRLSARTISVHAPRSKTPPIEVVFCEVVDMVPENWNQLETYIFDAYELIKGLNFQEGNRAQTVA